MATEPYRNTPILGPGLTDTGPYYWDQIAPDVDMPSYQPGTMVNGNDGVVYTHVTAGEALVADDRVNLDSDFEATKNASGTHVAVVDAADGAALHVKPYVA